MPGMTLLLPVHHHTVPLTNFFRSILKPPDFVSSLKVFMIPLSYGLGVLSMERNTQGALLHCGGLLLTACLPAGWVPLPLQSLPCMAAPGDCGASPITLSSETRRMLSSRQGRARRQRRPRAAA